MSKPKVKLNDLKMTVRIQMTEGGLYYGQVYVPEIMDDKNLLYYMNCNFEPGWKTITGTCLTKWGCKKTLNHGRKNTL